MSTREKYQITFQMVATQNGNTRALAISKTNENSVLSGHLNFSSLIETVDQIDSINRIISKYQSSLPFDDFWGEVAGSQLFVYPKNNTVEANYQIYPLPDFV